MIEKGGKNYAFLNIFGKAPTEAYTDTCMAASVYMEIGMQIGILLMQDMFNNINREKATD